MPNGNDDTARPRGSGAHYNNGWQAARTGRSNAGTYRHNPYNAAGSSYRPKHSKVGTTQMSSLQIAMHNARSNAPGGPASQSGKGHQGSFFKIRHDSKPSGLKGEDFELGTIIGTVHIVPNLDPRLQAGDKQRTDSALGPIMVKFRHFIVLAKFARHMITVPIISHGDRGIAHLPDQMRAEFMGIRHKGNTQYVNDTPYAPLETKGPLTFELMGTSNVHFVDPYSVKYDQQIKIEGYLTPESHEELAKNFEARLKIAFDEEEGEITTPVPHGPSVRPIMTNIPTVPVKVTTPVAPMHAPNALAISGRSYASITSNSAYGRR